MSARRVLTQQERFEVIWALKYRAEECWAAARMAEANDDRTAWGDWEEKAFIAQRLHEELEARATVVQVVFES